jgi:hypothetical protein
MLILIGMLILIAVVIAPTTAEPVTKNKYWGLGEGEWWVNYPDGTRELFSGSVEWKTSIWSNGKFQSIGQGELVGEVSGATYVGKLKVTYTPDYNVHQLQMIGTVFFPDKTSQKYHSEVKSVQGTETVKFFKWG